LAPASLGGVLGRKWRTSPSGLRTMVVGITVILPSSPGL